MVDTILEIICVIGTQFENQVVVMKYNNTRDFERKVGPYKLRFFKRGDYIRTCL